MRNEKSEIFIKFKTKIKTINMTKRNKIQNQREISTSNKIIDTNHTRISYILMAQASHERSINDRKISHLFCRKVLLSIISSSMTLVCL